MHPHRLLPAVLTVLHWLLDGRLVLANNNNGQNYGSFSSSGLDQDGGLQPAVGGYRYLFSDKILYFFLVGSLRRRRLLPRFFFFFSRFIRLNSRLAITSTYPISPIASGLFHVTPYRVNQSRDRLIYHSVSLRVVTVRSRMTRGQGRKSVDEEEE